MYCYKSKKCTSFTSMGERGGNSWWNTEVRFLGTCSMLTDLSISPSEAKIMSLCLHHCLNASNSYILQKLNLP